MTQFVCVVVEVATERCHGVDFCRDEAALRRKADMYRKDSGPEFIVMEHPPREREFLDSVVAALPA